ncbi:MAG: helix-turn-helix domain-containing protein, partial [Acidobacteria bacterium]|nr:helix-turn-helix domain-containing protein [Acidobacteriota bacterium]
MEEKNAQEVATRRRALRMWLNKKRPCEIIRQLARSHKWFYKWLERFKKFGWPGLADQSRRPHTPSPSYPASARQLVVRLRRRAQQRKVGLIGARVLHSEIKRHRLLPKAPSLTTINRWLKEADLLSSPGPAPEDVYYPHWRLPPGHVGHAMDWTARFLEGGEKVFAFHTLDLATHALAQTLSRDKAGESLHRHVLEAWQMIGLSDFLQLDNDAAFNGGGKTPRRIGAFVRLCLFLGIELIFIPPGEPERNGEVERVNGLWEESFWDRDHFR